MDAREEEIRRIRKEIAFLDARWKAFKHNLRTITLGPITAVVNGASSRDYSHVMYLDGRRERAVAKLQSLTQT